jgi:hypothetical protein
MSGLFGIGILTSINMGFDGPATAIGKADRELPKVQTLHSPVVAFAVS